jgi:hypothetical protein
MSGITIWHGSRRWDGSPEIRPTKKGQYECGPGIYCTTNLNTASKYSKGGGRIIRFTLDSEITWLEDASLPFDDVLAFVEGSRHIHKRRILAADIRDVFDRRDQVRTSGMMPLSYLVNLAINNECLSGNGGPELAEYLVDNGVQASLYHRSANDDWVVIFDPRAITNVELLSTKDIDWKEDQLPLVTEQLEALANVSGPSVPAL